MEVIKQVLRLKQDGISIRETARRLGISRNSVKKYLALLPDATAGDKALAGQVYKNDSLAHDEQRMAELHAHFNQHSEELSKTGVTRQLLWQEWNFLKGFKATSTTIMTKSTTQPVKHPIFGMNNRFKELPKKYSK